MSHAVNPLTLDARVGKAHLFLQAIVAAMILVFANIAIAHFAKTTLPRLLMRNIDAHPETTALACGNSLMEAGFDPAAFKENSDNVAPLNIGLGSSGTVEHLLLLRHALQSDTNVTLVLYGFFDFQLTDIPRDGWSDLVGNRAMAYYVEPYFAADLYSSNSKLQVLQTRAIGHVPMLVDRLALWAKIERIRRLLGQVGLPPEKSSQFGRAADFRAMEFADSSEFEKQCQRSANERVPLAAPISLMIDQARDHHANFVFIEMPMPTAHRNRFYCTDAWRSYDSHLREMITDRHCRLIDASAWVDDADFADNLHLAPSGALRFTKKLASMLASPS